jgi:LysM repeat protein
MFYFSIFQSVFTFKMRKLLFAMLILVVCAQSMAYAQPAYTGEWRTAEALQQWIGGEFYANLPLAQKIDTTKAYIHDIDSCIAHKYTGQLPLADGEVFTFALGVHFFEAEGKRFCWLVAATTDGYACKDCGMALSASLWQQAGGQWSVVFEERDFAVTGAAGVAPQVAFATIGSAGHIGVFVWQRQSFDDNQHFYLADIYALVDNHFAMLTRSNTANAVLLPNICNAVCGDEKQPYSYETDYELQENPTLEIYDINIRKQGTYVNKTEILPLDRTFFYHWSLSKMKYELMDSVDNIIFVPYSTQKNDNIKTIAKQQHTAESDIMAYNPMLSEVVGGSLDAIIPTNTTIFVRQIDLTTQANLEPSLASIEAAVGVPDDEKAAIDSIQQADNVQIIQNIDTTAAPTNVPQKIETYTPAPTLKNTDLPKSSEKTPDSNPAENTPQKTDLNQNIPIKTNRTHTVQPKETLFGIVQKYKVQMTDIQRINNLPADFSVKIGQVLDLGESPEPTKIAVQTTEKDVLKKMPKQEIKIPANPIDKNLETIVLPQKLHTVSCGETLFAIAKKYKVSVGHLQKTNKLKDYVVLVGQVLVIEN